MAGSLGEMNESQEDDTKSDHKSSPHLDEGDGGQEHGRDKDDEGDGGQEHGRDRDEYRENEVSLARSPGDEMLFENEKRKKKKGKGVGGELELELEIPLRPPPALPHQMYLMKASKMIGFEPKPFDPDTYVEQDETAGSSRNHAPLANNIIRWRKVKNPDGTTSIESNARFVQWDDDSLQLMIGNETFDTHVQNTESDQAHLFLRHPQGILQSQGRLQRKMSFTPSSLSSTSYQQLLRSRSKKVHKVKEFITKEKEKKQKRKQKIESQAILLNRRKAMIRRKEDLEMEAQRRKRLIIAKIKDKNVPTLSNLVLKDIPNKTSVSAAQPEEEEEYDTDAEEEEYDTDAEEEEDEESEEDADVGK